MTKSLFFGVLTTFALLAGCSSGDGEISVDSAATPLTDNANDQLFTIKVVDAPTDGYALDGLVVKATPKDKDTLTLACSPNDVNANKKLDTGDTLSCVEGTTNILGVNAAGTPITIELHATVDGKDTLVGDATWTPTK